MEFAIFYALKQWKNSTNYGGAAVRLKTYSSNQLFLSGLLTGISNPKTIVMFSTVIPQFSVKGANETISLVILSIIFLVLQFLSGGDVYLFWFQNKTIFT